MAIFTQHSYTYNFLIKINTMKRINAFLLVLVLFLSANLLANDDKNPLTEGFVVGNPEVQSINAMTFGPEGILFIGDSKSAMVTAIDTKDNVIADAPKALKMNKVDEQIAALLGTTADQITIQDMAVNPNSKMVYFAVHHRSGTPVLLKTDGATFQHVPLKKVNHSKTTLTNPVKMDAKDRRGRDLRIWSISDLSFYNGNVLVTGLSNEAFSSTFRKIPFPFKKEQNYSTLEIYHAAHGQYETYAPIKTFLPFEIGGEPHLIASYTCTPLVIFPMKQLKGGQHIKGKTVAELGNWNTPLDIIAMEKEGKSYLLMANSARAVMKIAVDKIATYKDYLTTKVAERSGTAGVDFINLPFVNVLQLDKLSDDQFVMLQRKSNGNLDLLTQGSRWL